MEDLQQFFYSTSKRIFIDVEIYNFSSDDGYLTVQAMSNANPGSKRMLPVLFKLRVGVRCASTRQLAKGLWRGPEIDKRSSAGLGI